MPPARRSERGLQRDVAARWTTNLAAAGWTPVSDVLLDGAQKLDPRISNSELLLIIHLMRFKWDAGAPFPAFKTLAAKMGMTATSVRNHARSLERKGYLRRRKRVGSTNLFDLAPLFEALEALHVKMQEERAMRRRRPEPSDDLFDIF